MFDLSAKKTAVEASWKIQSLQEIVNDNIPYFRFLVERLGDDAGRKWIDEYLTGISEQLGELRKGFSNGVVQAKVEMRQVGDGLRFWPFLSRLH